MHRAEGKEGLGGWQRQQVAAGARGLPQSRGASGGRGGGWSGAARRAGSRTATPLCATCNDAGWGVADAGRVFKLHGTWGSCGRAQRPSGCYFLYLIEYVGNLKCYFVGVMVVQRRNGRARAFLNA